MPPSYKASLSTGVFGTYHVTYEASNKVLTCSLSESTVTFFFFRVSIAKKKKPKEKSAYYPSISTGVFGSYVIRVLLMIDLCCVKIRTALEKRKKGRGREGTKKKKIIILFLLLLKKKKANEIEHFFFIDIYCIASSGVFGSYTLKTSSSQYVYRPSVSTGVFGSYTVSHDGVTKPQATIVNRIEKPVEVVRMERGADPPKAFGVEIIAQWDVHLLLPNRQSKTVQIMVASG
ncbi:hypothetical protein RFI_22344 [Reticulomyxa filosa]|uniref:Uncharacterized protein n=1 Tax=Reticulomyxa filosa TaxID=46433 RepID=X6MLY5_RETFI|nr:hypothetical protein RFI_22344 [Reticulomyxa filosa]|eukprot:ETO15023.1 hypothetical protein RFI_22344 [Reticulomyxa filosa]